MEKFLGEWIVYDYETEYGSVEEVYTISFIFLEAENRLQTKLIKFIPSFEPQEEQAQETVFISDDAVFEAGKNEIMFSLDTDIGIITTKINFFSEKLFRAYSYDPIEPSIEIRYIVGVKKSDHSVFPSAKIFGKFSLTEFQNIDNIEKIVCTADLEIKLKTDFNSINPFVSPKLTGRYYNFLSSNEEFNEYFSKDYEIEGQVYADNHVSFIVRFGEYNVCGYDLKMNEQNAVTAIWFNFRDDGITKGSKIFEAL